MIQGTRVLVLVSTVLAALVEGYLGSGTSRVPQVLWIGVGGFLLMLSAGHRWRWMAMPILMASLYLTPAILFLTYGAVDYGLDAIWLLPLLGLILSDRGTLDWSLPGRWQWPLITWTAMVSLTWLCMPVTPSRLT